MKRLHFSVMLVAAIAAGGWCRAAEAEKNVPWRAAAEIARRGALVERTGGTQSADNPLAAIAAAMQPPADDSHKWLFTLVTTRNCQWCAAARRDFEQDPKLKAWVDTKDHTKSWAHWQVLQMEDKSQEWRWKDFRPTAFPALIVQPPVNGSWGDPHTIVFVRQGYLKPGELDAAIRKAIQLYANKAFPRHLVWEGKQDAAHAELKNAGFQQGGVEQAQGGWTPPVAPPVPLPPVPSAPPQTYPPAADPTAPAGIHIPLSLPSLTTILLLLTAVSNVWMLYRELAQKMGVKLLLTDEQARKLVDLLPKLNTPPSPPASAI